MPTPDFEAFEADAALITDPDEQAGIARLRAALLLRMDPAAGLAALQPLDLGSAISALDYRAESGKLAEPEVGAKMIELLEEIPERSQAAVALALWAGQGHEEAGMPRLSEIECAQALSYAAAYGYPADWNDLFEVLETYVEDLVGRSAVINQHVTVRRDLPLDMATAAVERMEEPSLKLRALTELAVRTLEPGEFAERWLELARPLVAEIGVEEVVEGASHGLLAAVAARPAHDEAKQARDKALAGLANTTHAQSREYGYRGVLMASTAMGVAFWRDALHRIASDTIIRSDAHHLGTLVFEAVHLIAVLPGGADARSAALADVVESLRDVHDPMLRAVLSAEMAQLSADIPGRSPATWLSDVGTRLASYDDPSADLMSKVGEIVASFDPEAARNLAGRLKRPFHRCMFRAALVERSLKG